ncbi:trans-sulfuration enzyme family protein [Actomonas aquatica]|uniref:Aminotransferase class I/II-fold pyridoxal phosphate-dependent enzyme n=1 Tax=Actomonas aquatica TaxID=2866162 RepID=A0ABZ1C487_9BACT|nr:aminotransferase class I/II-fold pyridoxal phosphate-dependent enzyme [Opitutus sp. WL0086]WRQ86531.1 aminotransferase class I/II-fold pyridoxal phosphate-dependent enzyme [Opitutus sp. WL0086]
MPHRPPLPPRPTLETLCAHAGRSRREPEPENTPFVPSIAQSTIFHLGDSAQAEAIFAGARPGYAYSRFGNPTVEALAVALADLEDGAGALVTSSGNAAVLCAVAIAMDGRNGPLVTHPDIYGGSFELLQILSSVLHVPVQFIDAQNPTAWSEALVDAGAVLLESPSNPLMRLIDLKATVEAAHQNDAPVIVDNTIATPFNQSPFLANVDWIIHSTTKYLNGHSDMIGGALISRQPLTPNARRIHKNLGGTVNAFDAWLVLRGLRTFALRMAAHNHNGAAIAAWLLNRPEVSRVHYAGLPDHPQAAVGRRQMKHGGAVLSFELKGGRAAAERFIDRLRLIVHAVSLGGMESLATRPAMSSHRGMGDAERERAGISDSLIRLSIGIEDLGEIKADLGQALADH